MYSTAEKYFKYSCDHDLSLRESFQQRENFQPIGFDSLPPDRWENPRDISHKDVSHKDVSRKDISHKDVSHKDVSHRDIPPSLNRKHELREYMGKKYGDKTLVKLPNKINTSAPDYWGSAFWKSLHLSAFYYPEQASTTVAEIMKNRILALPYEIPCASCRHHCMAYVDSNKCKLDTVCATRDGLFKFYVDFHNAVNKRKGEPEMPLEMAYAIYSGDAVLQ